MRDAFHELCAGAMSKDTLVFVHWESLLPAQFDDDTPFYGRHYYTEKDRQIIGASDKYDLTNFM